MTQGAPLLTNALNTGGGAPARFIVVMQNPADPEAAMGPAQARRVRDNLNTKIWCRLAEDRTAAATADLGLCTVRLPDTGIGFSYGGVGGRSGSSQRRLVAKATLRIRPHWLPALPRGEACVRMQGVVWKLGLSLLTPRPQITVEWLVSPRAGTRSPLVSLPRVRAEGRALCLVCSSPCCSSSCS